MKQCTKCKQLKDESCFVKNNKSKDGLSWWCRDCKKTHNQATQDKIIAYRQSQPNYDREYYEKNKEQIKLRKQKYYQDNSNKIKEADKLRHQKNKLGRNVSKALASALKGAKSEQHWEDLVGYSILELKEHLEKQFTPEMNWDNYGDNSSGYSWELDHIVPQNYFHYQSPNDTDFKICWSLANLRPLEYHQNRSRPKDGSDIPEELRQQILNSLRTNNME